MPDWQTLPSADLALSMAATPDVVKKGRPLTYHLTVLDAGPSAAGHVVVTDPLPAESRFVGASSSQGGCLTPPPGSTGTVTCDLGFMFPAASATVDIGVTIVVRKSSVSNTASVSSGTPDPNPSNDTVTIVTPVK